MNRSELSRIKDIEHGYKNAIDSVASSLKCDWNDPVHNSFLLYVKDMNNHSNTLSKIYSDCESDFSKIEVTESLIERANNICSEVFSV